MTIDAAGNLYGTSEEGGVGSCLGYGCGVVYTVDTAGHEKVLYTFTGMSDGGAPYAAVTLDSAGNLYGTTNVGGANNAGVVYKLEPGGKLTVLYDLPPVRPANAIVSEPSALTPDAAGNFYFTTYLRVPSSRLSVSP